MAAYLMRRVLSNSASVHATVINSKAQLMKFLLIRQMIRGAQVNRHLGSLFPDLSSNALLRLASRALIVPIIFVMSMTSIVSLVSMISLAPGVGLCACLRPITVQEIKKALDLRDLGISDEILDSLLNQESSPGTTYRSMAEVAHVELSYAAYLRQRNLHSALSLLEGISDVNEWLRRSADFAGMGTVRIDAARAGAARNNANQTRANQTRAAQDGTTQDGALQAGEIAQAIMAQTGTSACVGLVSSMLGYSQADPFDGHDSNDIPLLNEVVSRYLALRGYDEGGGEGSEDDRSAWQKVKDAYRTSRYFTMHEPKIHALAEHSWVATYREADIRQFVQALSQQIKGLTARYKAYESGQNIGIFTTSDLSARVFNYGDDCISNIILRGRASHQPVPAYQPETGNQPVRVNQPMSGNWPEAMYQPAPDHRSAPRYLKTPGYLLETTTGPETRICGKSSSDIFFNGGISTVSSLDFLIMGTQVSIPFSPDPVLPDFSFRTLSSTEHAPKEVYLNALSHTIASQGYAVNGYLWDFGDGTPVRAGGEMTHIYARPGEYTLTLTVILSNGLTRTIQKKIDVLNPVTAYFTSNSKTNSKAHDPSSGDQWEGWAPLTVSFDASGSSHLTGSITGYHWDFGDKCQGVGRTVSHTFTLPGRYEVTLTISDRNNNADTMKRSLTVLNPIQPDFLVLPGSGPALTNFTFDASKSSSRLGKIVSYEWDFGDEDTKAGPMATGPQSSGLQETGPWLSGPQATEPWLSGQRATGSQPSGPQATGPRVTHQYGSNGYKTVTLTVQNEQGISARIKKPVTVGTGISAFISNQTIDCDTVWSPYHIYVLSGSITIAEGATLTIEPGTVIKGGNQSSRLIVNGALVARGTKRAPVIFTSFRDDIFGGDTNADSSASVPAAGDWDGIYFYSTSTDSACVLDHCLIKYAGYGSQGCGISCKGASPVISNCMISHNRTYGVRLKSASPAISNCTIAQNSHSGVFIEGDSSAVITGCNIYHNSVYGICSFSTATVHIRRNTFAGNGSYAVYLCCTSGISTADNTISDYGGGIYLLGTVTTDMRLAGNPGCPYVLNNLTVAEGATLTIEPGVVIKGDMQGGRLVINGALVAKGTELAPVVFTSLRDDACEGDTNNDGRASLPAAGDWDGIFLCSTRNDSACVLDRCIIQYAGYGNEGCALSLSNTSPVLSHCIINHNRIYGLRIQGASPIISNCTIAHSGHSGILSEGNSNPVIIGCIIHSNDTYGIYSFSTSSPLIDRNTFSDNGSCAAYLCCAKGISVSGNTATGSGGKICLLGTITNSGRMGHNPNCPYVLNSLTVAENASLTIEPGAVIKGENQASRLVVNGTLVARGTERDMIVFTSFRDNACGRDTNPDRAYEGENLARAYEGETNDAGSSSLPAAGDWDGIFFYDTSNDSACVLDHCLIRYAGYGSQGCGISLISASPAISHCTISHNRAYGLRLQDASSRISNCTIADNAHSGILNEGNSYPAITGCNIHHNSAYGIYSWGTATPLIDRNTFADNGSYAISMSCTGSISISDNTVNGNGGGIYLSGAVTVDTHLANNPDCPYVLNDLTIADGVTLTIEPGIAIKGGHQCSQMVINGASMTTGTLSSPIIENGNNWNDIPMLRWR
ncbi:MAG: right-handed parallel beta-helix repeat-containing protein [bacterium]